MHIDDDFIEVERNLRNDFVRADARAFHDDNPRLAHLRNLDLLTWSRHFLPHYFPIPPSAMHIWLAAQLDRISSLRASNFELVSDFGFRDSNFCRPPLHLNLLAPRGSAKSTLATFTFVLHQALFARHPYIWIVSDTHHQAAAHLENIKTELLENAALREAFPDATGQGPIWRRGTIILNNRVMIEA